MPQRKKKAKTNRNRKQTTSQSCLFPSLLSPLPLSREWLRVRLAAVGGGEAKGRRRGEEEPKGKVKKALLFALSLAPLAVRDVAGNSIPIRDVVAGRLDQVRKRSQLDQKPRKCAQSHRSLTLFALTWASSPTESRSTDQKVPRDERSLAPRGTSACPQREVEKLGSSQ